MLATVHLKTAHDAVYDQRPVVMTLFAEGCQVSQERTSFRIYSTSGTLESP